VKFLRSAAFALGVVVAASLSAPMVAADAPAKSSFVFSYGFEDPVTCPFPIEASETVDATLWLYTSAGSLVGEKVVASDVTTLSNPASGASLAADDHWVNTFDAATGTQAVHGLYLNFEIPGVGIAVLDAGTIRIGPAPDYAITFSAGQHQGYWQGDTAAVCAALS
jgi:hypothetical protein